MTEPFKFSDGQSAYTVEELISLCQQFPSESLDFLMRQDFEKWLDYIGKSDLAVKAQQIRQASLSDSDRIKQFIAQCQTTPVTATKSTTTTTTPDANKSEAKVASTATKAPAASTATKAPAAPTATKVPTAPTATKIPAASTATKTPAAPTATKKTNPLASLVQKLFGKK